MIDIILVLKYLKKIYALFICAVLWRELSRMKVTSPMAGLDELSTLRSQIRQQFAKLVQGGIAKINTFKQVYIM